MLPGPHDHARRIAADLRARRPVTDAEFDALLPPGLRARSGDYWTAVEVATTAVGWLVDGGATRLLDVGAGVGKFCTIAATQAELRVVGVERRAHLVDAARALAQALGVETRVTFVAGDLDAVRLDEHDALYLYNPFSEGLYPRASRLDDSVAIGPGRAQADIDRIEQALVTVAPGVQVVTYGGYGGRVPDSFRCVHAADFDGGRLRCWQQGAAGARGWICEHEDHDDPARS
jgi:SAM-dependent methyltransferase